MALFAENVSFERIIVGISHNLVAREIRPMATEKSSSRSWMSDAAIYQIYPRSFKDSTGSGLGDIAGITQQMDYLERLGIEAIWLSPFYPSPLVDGGYDVADYCDVDPRLGSLDDFDDMIAAAHTHGIKVIVDIVPNHSSNQHPWFKAALAAGPGSPERARYIFRDGRGEHGELPPTNWNANFGGPAWTRVADGQWYLHMFTPEQPDFDWSCPEVRAFFCDVLAFWSDRGVDGFRIDVAHGLAKDLDRDDLDRWHLAEGDDMVDDGTHPLWDRNEVHEIYREWRRVFDRYNPPRSAVAEAWVLPERQYLYARPSELGQTFNFEFAKATWTYDDMHAAIEEGLKAAIESNSASTWVLSNHDVPRVATRYALPQIKATRYHQIALDWLLRDGSSYDEDVNSASAARGRPFCLSWRFRARHTCIRVRSSAFLRWPISRGPHSKILLRPIRTDRSARRGATAAVCPCRGWQRTIPRRADRLGFHRRTPMRRPICRSLHGFPITLPIGKKRTRHRCLRSIVTPSGCGASCAGAPTISRGSILTGAPALRMVPRALRAASSPIAATTAGRV